MLSGDAFPFRRFDDALDVDAELAKLGMSEDDLDAALDAGPPLGLGPLLEPDADFVARVARRAERRLADREAINALADLMAVPWLTLRTLLDGDSEQ